MAEDLKKTQEGYECMEERCPYLIAYNGKYSCVSSIIGPKCEECYIKYPRDYE